MNLTLERSHLAAAMSRIANIVDRKQTIPVLSHVLLEASGDVLQIRATNLDMEAIETVPAVVKTEGTITVPADMLNELARNLPQGAQVNMATDKTKLACTSGRTKVNLPTLPSEQFPSIWSTKWTTEFDIDGANLAHMLGRVSFAQDDSSAYAYLQGVHMLEKDGKLRLVATDRNVMAYADGPDVGGFDPVTIPSRMVVEMARMDGPCTVSISEALVQVSNSNSVITSKLIDKSMAFPAYERVIPATSPNGAVITIVELTTAIKMAMISRDAGAKDQTVRLGFSSGALAVTAKNTVSDAFDEISVDYEGADVSIPLTPQRVLNLLSTIQSENVCVAFGDKKAPMVWRAPGDEGGLVVIMPQRID